MKTGNLHTIGDFIRYGITLFNGADLDYGHGTHDAVDEAAFLLLEALHMPPDTPLEHFWNCRLTPAERKKITALYDARVKTRKPAPYLVNRAYIQGVPFYVDERTIVPRSFIGELLGAGEGFSLAGDPAKISSVLDLCTGSGCLAVMAAYAFPGAHVDAVDISQDALDVARRNVAEHGLEHRITLRHGDLFAPVKDARYDLIVTNPPYVDADGMNALPPEFRHEPALALDGGEDGIDLVRRIVDELPAHLNPGGGILCEIGRGRETIESAYPALPFRWIDTENSSGEVFWLSRAN